MTDCADRISIQSLTLQDSAAEECESPDPDPLGHDPLDNVLQATHNLLDKRYPRSPLVGRKRVQA
jgi:hypothetical protein